MGQQQQTTVAMASSTLRRTILALLVAALMAALMLATAMPAMADIQRSGDHGRPSVSGDINGQGKGSDVFHNENGACVSHVGDGDGSGKSTGRGCL